jgi:hypothetical protein
VITDKAMMTAQKMTDVSPWTYDRTRPAASESIMSNAETLTPVGFDMEASIYAFLASDLLTMGNGPRMLLIS